MTFISRLPHEDTLREIASPVLTIETGLSENLPQLAGTIFRYPLVSAWLEHGKEALDMALEAIGILEATPIVGWILSALAWIPRLVAAGLRGGQQYAPGCLSPGRPKTGVPASFKRDIDEDMVRQVIAATNSKDQTKFWEPPVLGVVEYPSPADRCKASGGHHKLVDGGFLLPGGRLFWGYKHQHGKTQRVAEVICPSAALAAQSAWVAMQRPGLGLFSIAPLKLRDAWIAAVEHMAFLSVHGSLARHAWKHVYAQALEGVQIYNPATRKLDSHSKKAPYFLPVYHTAIEALAQLAKSQAEALSKAPPSLAYTQPGSPGVTDEQLFAAVKKIPKSAVDVKRVHPDVLPHLGSGGLYLSARMTTPPVLAPDDTQPRGNAAAVVAAGALLWLL